MNRDRCLELVGRFAGRRVTVVGDLMMDEYLWGNASRISPESPVMVVDVERESRVPGGAANVVNNLLSLGAAVSVVGVVGDDSAGRQLCRELEQRGADVRGVVVDRSRPTTRKTRVVAHSQQVLRVDRERSGPVSDHVQARLAAAIHDCTACEAILVSDYHKGVLTPRVAAEAVRVARTRRVWLTANPKPANARSLGGAHLVSLNQSEARDASGDERFGDEATFEAAGAALLAVLDVENLVVTRGARGLSIWSAGGAVRHVPARPVEVYDVAGAGDTVVSAITLGLVAGAGMEDAADLANHAASCVVRKLGVAVTTAEEILAEWADA